MTGSGKTTTGNDAGGLDAARLPATSRRRAYTAALRAARALAGFGPTGILRSSDIDPDPETIERYRHLLIAVAVTRGGSDGAGVVAVVRRGYVVVPGATAGGKLPRHVYPITTAGAVWLGGGLPGRGSPWRAIAGCAREIDASALPLIDVVSAHVSLAIRRELPRDGHDVG